MKIFIARFMLMIMLITTIMPSLSMTLVYANVVATNTRLAGSPALPISADSIGATFDGVRLDRSFVGGHSPRPNPHSPTVFIPAEGIRLDLGLTGIDASNNALFYFVVPGANPQMPMQKIEFEVSQTDSPLRLRATYRILQFDSNNDNPWSNVPITSNGVQIFSGTHSAFVSVGEFSGLDPNLNLYNHTVSVEGDEIIFDFSVDQGFSFRDPTGREIHFLHSSTLNSTTSQSANTIRFETDGIQQDLIYRFNRVMVDNSSGNRGPTTYVRAFRGMNSDPNAFNFIPFSLANEGDLNNNTSLNFRNDGYTLDFNEGDQTIEGGVGIAIRFQEPQEIWIAADGTPRITPLSVMSRDYGIDYVMPIALTMTDTYSTGSGPKVIIAQNIANLQHVENLAVGPEGDGGLTIQQAPPNISAPIQPTIEDGSWIGWIDTDNQGRRTIEIRIQKLTPGLMFTNSSVSVTHTASNNANFTAEEQDIALRLNGGASVINLGRIFTFPNYRFVFRDDQFHIDILTPFRNTWGVYAVTSNLSGDTEVAFVQGVAAEDTVCTECGPLSCEECACCTVTISIPWTMGHSDTLQILFQPNTDLPNFISDFNAGTITPAYSERSRFTPHPGIMHLGAPRNFEVANYNLRPLDIYDPLEAWGTEGLLSMELEWIVGNVGNIREMINYVPEGETADPNSSISVNYALNNALRPEAGLGSPFAFVDMEMRLQGDLILADYVVTDRYENIMTSGQRPLRQEGLFAIMDLELDNIPASFLPPPSSELENDDPRFFFPRIYHINMDTVVEIPNEPEPRRLPSVFQTITLNDLLRPELPPVQNLTIIEDSVTQSSVSFDMNISGAQVREFMQRSSYSEASLGGQLEFSLNLHISHDEDLMRQLAQHHGHYARRYVFQDTDSFDASNLTDDTGEFDVLLSGEALQALRDGNIAIIENISLEDIIPDINEFLLFGMDIPVVLNVGGLDENQMYYVYIAFASTFSEGNLVDHQESNFSELLGFTSLGEPNIPGDGDMVPTAPVLNIRDVGLDTATVYWPHVELHLPESDISVHYEIVRIRGEQMNPDWTNTPADINEFIDLITNDMPDSEIRFLQTPPHEGARELQIWNGSDFVNVDPSQFSFTFTPLQVELLDNTLASNQIYFYYVRTVRTVEGLNTYSMWAAETVTTSTLSAPINLQVDLETDVEYDPQREFMIRFDAEIVHLELLGPEVVFEFSIREEDGEFSEPVRMNSQILIDTHSESTFPGHTRFSYRISNLIPNTGYTIRVRMLNLRTNDISPWSLVTTTRTDMDQELADEERDLDAWLHYYRQELEELIRLPYWTLQDTSAEFRVVYRPSMFNTIIATTTGSQILLAQSSNGAHTHVYYIPACMMRQASQQDIGFTIRVDEVEVIMPANTLNEELNEDIRHAISQIDNPNNSAVDYFIRISARTVPHSSNVQNTPPLSPQLQLNFDVVSTDETAEYWDNYILDMHIEEINNQMDVHAINNWIINSLRSDVPAIDIVRYILDLVDRMRTSLINDTERSFNRVRRFSNVVHQLDVAMIIIYRDTSHATVINGYRWANGNWQLLERSQFGEFVGIRSNMPGSFIFAGRIVMVNGLDQMANAGITFAIITRHSLHDILGSNHNINLEGAVTRSMFTDSVARIGGSPSGADALQFLRARGHFIPSGNQQANITMQEALYLTMVVYEMRTGTRAETIIIRNHGNTANMQGIDPRFLQSIRAAFELGLHPNPNIQANDSVTINEMLQMLTLLDSKVDL